MSQVKDKAVLKLLQQLNQKDQLHKAKFRTLEDQNFQLDEQKEELLKLRSSINKFFIDIQEKKDLLI